MVGDFVWISLLADAATVLSVVVMLVTASNKRAREAGAHAAQMKAMQEQITSLRKFCEDIDANAREGDGILRQMKGEMTGIENMQNELAAAMRETRDMISRHLLQAAQKGSPS